MARRLFTLLSALSLLLCVATAMLWVRSADTGDSVRWSWWRPSGDAYRKREIELTTGRGGLRVGVSLHVQSDAPAQESRLKRFERRRPAPGVRWHAARPLALAGGLLVAP